MKILVGVLVCIIGALISNILNVQEAVTGFLVTAAVIAIGGAYSLYRGSSP